MGWAVGRLGGQGEFGGEVMEGTSKQSQEDVAEAGQARQERRVFWGRWWWTGACISLPPGVAPPSTSQRPPQRTSEPEPLPVLGKRAASDIPDFHLPHAPT